jgi:hypothetical protein
VPTDVTYDGVFDEIRCAGGDKVTWSKHSLGDDKNWAVHSSGDDKNWAVLQALRQQARPPALVIFGGSPACQAGRRGQLGCPHPCYWCRLCIWPVIAA